MQIAFLTLFLGLVSGPLDVELAVQGGVTQVELLLDGRPVALLDGPPWSTRVDLGPDLAPRRLAARALGAGGVELARTEQWLNVPRPAAELEALLEPGPDGRAAAVQVSFESIVGRDAEIELTFDGERLPVAGTRAALPRYDTDAPHVLTAEARFPNGTIVRRDLLLGGLYTGAVATELTALPVRTAGRPAPSREAAAGWFLLEGREPLSAVAIEKGEARVLVVRDLEPWATEWRLRGPRIRAPQAAAPTRLHLRRQRRHDPPPLAGQPGGRGHRRQLRQLRLLARLHRPGRRHSYAVGRRLPSEPGRGPAALGRRGGRRRSAGGGEQPAPRRGAGALRHPRGREPLRPADGAPLPRGHGRATPRLEPGASQRAAGRSGRLGRRPGRLLGAGAPPRRRAPASRPPRAAHRLARRPAPAGGGDPRAGGDGDQGRPVIRRGAACV